MFYILSDFQKNSSDVESVKTDSAIWTYLLPFQPVKTNNLLVDSCWFDVPGRKMGKAEKLYAHVRNLSKQAYQNIPVRLTINDTLKAISNININGNEETTIELNYTNNSQGIQLCKVELDDYPIIYDNKYFFSYKVLAKLKALGIYNSADNGSEYLKALFKNDDLISYEENPENNIQISQLKNYQCIFLANDHSISSGLRSELKNYVTQGGTLVIFPAKLSNYNDYNELLSSLEGKTIAKFDTSSIGIAEINYNHELYHDVFSKKEKEADLPAIKGRVVFENQFQKAEIPILTFRNGQFPIDKENLNFVRHVIFVPTVYNMVLNSGERQHLAYSTALKEPVILEQSDIPTEVTIRNYQNNSDYLCTTRTIGFGKKQIDLGDIQTDAGHYLVMDNNRIIQALSFNYPRNESVSEYLSEADYKKWLNSDVNHSIHLISNQESDFGKALKDINNGKQLWKYFIILALLFLLGEMAIIRFWK